MAEKNNIESLFKSALEHHEMPVRPEVWSGIQASLAQSAAVGSATSATGSAVLGKAAAVIGMAALITGATISEVSYHTANDLTSQADAKSQIIESTAPVADEETVVVSAEHNAADEVTDRVAAKDNSEPIESIETTGEITAQPQAGQDELAADNSDQEAENESPIESNSSGQQSHPSEAKEASTQVADNQKEVTSPKVAQQPDIEESESKETVKEAGQEEPAKTTAYFTHEAEQVITPNGDPYNEYFEIKGYGVGDFFIRIMTRTGKVVFESSDMNFRWNGIDRFGNQVPEGVYYFEIQAVGADGIPYLEKNAKGSVTIVRQ